MTYPGSLAQCLPPCINGVLSFSAYKFGCVKIPWKLWIRSYHLAKSCGSTLTLTLTRAYKRVCQQLPSFSLLRWWPVSLQPTSVHTPSTNTRLTKELSHSYSPGFLEIWCLTVYLTSIEQTGSEHMNGVASALMMVPSPSSLIYT